ncbi:MAG: PAS domain-containing protein [Candidatus Accumulibacter sp.]|jgi:two-component system sensor histidine kinase PilS (NtrC family)|nr:PAS domain-containing protein [Accumulibacter sp.]
MPDFLSPWLPSQLFGYFDDNAADVSTAHWKSLRYFLFYRFCIAWILLVFFILQALPLSSVFEAQENLPQCLAIFFYLITASVSIAVFRRSATHFNLKLSFYVLVDVIVFSFLIHVGGGLRNALGVIMLASLAGACLVGHGILVLFYASLATVAILLGELIKIAVYGFDIVGLFQSGIFSACFFGVGISSRLIAKRLIENERLAQRQKLALKNQMLVNQRVIEEMHDGILVLSQDGNIKQHNPRAGHLLGLGDLPVLELRNYAPELAARFFLWRAHPVDKPLLFKAKASGVNFGARFIPTESSENDVLVFIEDMEHLQEQARQLKLAALGRLTANIAHEIRNPLSAINHAGALLNEKTPDDRLTRIILDNVRRVERIVSDILELGHRDKISQEALNLRLILPNLVEEYDDGKNGALETVIFEISGIATLLFDRVHFHQVMWNLLGNALRYSLKKRGSVRLIVYDSAKDGEICLHVRDDGLGIAPGLMEQIFEPFFTTHSKGTGLGLYIARELCEANGARIKLLNTSSGTDFCISGKAAK